MTYSIEDILKELYNIPEFITKNVIESIVEKYDMWNDVKNELKEIDEEYYNIIKDYEKYDQSLYCIFKNIEQKHPIAFTRLGVYRDEILKDIINELFNELWKNKEEISTEIKEFYSAAEKIFSYIKKEYLVAIRTIPAGSKQDYWYVFVSKK